jgi:drug/metabolite transporter (DMT)-like permease
MINDRLALSQAALLLAYAAGMAGGQLLFKAAALRYASEAPLGERLLSLVQNAYFLTAIALYVALTVVWVWILTFTPLSRAYPFVALAFAITPLLAGFVFGEAVTARLMLGIGFILSGLLLVAG